MYDVSLSAHTAAHTSESSAAAESGVRSTGTVNALGSTLVTSTLVWNWPMGHAVCPLLTPPRTASPSAGCALSAGLALAAATGTSVACMLISKGDMPLCLTHRCAWLSWHTRLVAGSQESQSSLHDLSRDRSWNKSSMVLHVPEHVCFRLLPLQASVTSSPW